MYRNFRQPLSSGLGLLLTLLCVPALVAASPPAAQDADAPADAETSAELPADPKPLTEPLIAKLNVLRDTLPEQRVKISGLEKRVAKGEGLVVEILNIRLDLAWLSLLEDALSFAAAVVASEEDGFDVSDYTCDVIEALGEQLDVASTAIERTHASVKLRTVKIRFDEEGISIPFPQRDVHHYSEVPANHQPGTT